VGRYRAHPAERFLRQPAQRGPQPRQLPAESLERDAAREHERLGLTLGVAPEIVAEKPLGAGLQLDDRKRLSGSVQLVARRGGKRLQRIDGEPVAFLHVRGVDICAPATKGS
jgi:hypothetical protein